MLMSLTYPVSHGFSSLSHCLSVTFHINSEKPGTYHLSSIYLFIQSQYTCTVVLGLLIWWETTAPTIVCAYVRFLLSLVLQSLLFLELLRAAHFLPPSSVRLCLSYISNTVRYFCQCQYSILRSSVFCFFFYLYILRLKMSDSLGVVKCIVSCI